MATSIFTCQRICEKTEPTWELKFSGTHTHILIHHSMLSTDSLLVIKNSCMCSMNEQQKIS